MKRIVLALIMVLVWFIVGAMLPPSWFKDQGTVRYYTCDIC